MSVTVKMVQMLRTGLLNMMYYSPVKKMATKWAQSLMLNAHYCIRNSVLSLSLGGSRAFFCHGAKKVKMTFGWCETGAVFSYLASVLAWKDASSFPQKLFITDSLLSKLLSVLELEAGGLCST